MSQPPRGTLFVFIWDKTSKHSTPNTVRSTEHNDWGKKFWYLFSCWFYWYWQAQLKTGEAKEDGWLTDAGSKKGGGITFLQKSQGQLSGLCFSCHLGYTQLRSLWFKRLKVNPTWKREKLQFLWMPLKAPQSPVLNSPKTHICILLPKQNKKQKRTSFGLGLWG